MSAIYSVISDHIRRATGTSFRFDTHRPLGGGCIGRSEVLEGEGLKFFVKLGSSTSEMLEAEVDGLRALRSSSPLRVPAPVCSGVWRGTSYLVLEYLNLVGRGSAAAHRALGRGLADLHRATSDRYGWHRDNTIGSTPQANGWCDRWIEFYRERRLVPQLELARRNGMEARTLSLASELTGGLEGFFVGYVPRPSLLHGDLWGGNFAVDEQGDPAVFDPAPYYGDREADIAMTELFGGFDRAFYDAYHAAWPLHSGYGARKDLYNLYHVLNHFNLFGGGYAAQAGGMIRELLSSLD
jgi:fructosamine-3-kinase